MNQQDPQIDKENLQKPLDDLSDLGSRPKNLVDDAHQKLIQANTKIREVEERLQHKGQELKEKAENLYEKGVSKKVEYENQEGNKAGLEEKKEKVFNLANKWVDQVLNAENPSLEPKVHEITEKISKKIEDIKGEVLEKKEEILANQPEIHKAEIQQKAHQVSSQIHQAVEEVKSNLKQKQEGNVHHPTLANQLAQGLHNVSNTISHSLDSMKTAFQTTPKTNISAAGDRQGELLEQEEAQPLTGKPASRKNSDISGPHNQTLKEKMQEGLHTLGSMISQGVQTVKRKLSSAQEPAIVRRKTINLDEEEDDVKLYGVGEEFREALAGFSKTVDEDWQEERVDELSKVGVSENPFEPFGDKDIHIPPSDEVHHETWFNREDAAPFIKGDELVFTAEGVRSSKCENWSRGLAQRSRKDIENIDRQLDKVISGKEREEESGNEGKYQGFKDITNEVSQKKSEESLSSKVEKGVEENEKILEKAIMEGGVSEDKENLGKKKGKAGKGKKGVDHSENIANVAQNV